MNNKGRTEVFAADLRENRPDYRTTDGEPLTNFQLPKRWEQLVITVTTQLNKVNF